MNLQNIHILAGPVTIHIIIQHEHEKSSFFLLTHITIFKNILLILSRRVSRTGSTWVFRPDISASSSSVDSTALLCFSSAWFRDSWNSTNKACFIYYYKCIHTQIHSKKSIVEEKAQNAPFTFSKCWLRVRLCFSSSFSIFRVEWPLSCWWCSYDTHGANRGNSCYLSNCHTRLFLIGAVSK